MTGHLPEQTELALDPWESRIMRVYESDRSRCPCRDHPKPCVYHEGMRDACEIIADRKESGSE